MAASVNPVDFKTQQGKYVRVTQEHLPMTLGRDVSGVVEAAGPQSAFKTGDEVMAFLGRDRGGYAEYVLVKPNEGVAKPKSLNHAQAASVPLAAMTAWQALFDAGGLKAGQRVLIHGGTGGVGYLGVQFAHAQGAWVATTVSQPNLDFVRELGADQAIDYRNEMFEKVVEPVDVVFDTIAGDTRERSWGVLKPGGILVSVLGEPSQETARAHGVRAVAVLARQDAAQLAEVGALIDAGKVQVIVQSTYPLVHVGAAHTALERGPTRGKIVIEIDH
jgi:NADPH:quinone reductase-like Zn-dependent oxidoreductase